MGDQGWNDDPAHRPGDLMYQGNSGTRCEHHFVRLGVADVEGTVEFAVRGAFQ